ncbi:uncharacterized protein LOC103989458 [Musa acuminata AAA Group]|uniref:uncharacterized protein LOC103989458 n=1 Tax=Musa acuminata AAA Group TaxID=214697 RepID=UPI0031D3FC10
MILIIIEGNHGHGTDATRTTIYTNRVATISSNSLPNRNIIVFFLALCSQSGCRRRILRESLAAGSPAMASACVNDAAPPPDTAFLDFAPACPVYGWLSPRISFSRDLADGSGPDPEPVAAAVTETPDADDPGKDLPDFEFRLEDPVAMLPADELFSDGKLVPLQISAVRPAVELAEGIPSPEAEKPRGEAEVIGAESCEKSPKAPRCSNRWRDLLGLKKLQNLKAESQKTSSLPCKGLNSSTRSLRNLLRQPKPSSSADSSLSVPLLRDSESELASISARRSLSSSGADHEELPRLSLDSEKPAQAPPRVRLSRPRGTTPEGVPNAGRSPVRRGAEVDSPRMNASGKVVFQGLERSSSSPGSFHGGGHHHHHRVKPYRGMERSYSANVRVAPVLNVVPVGSLRVGLGQLFSPIKKERDVNSHNGGGSSSSSRRKIIDKEKA